MTPFNRFDAGFDRRLFDALDGLASPQFPDYFDDVLAQAVARRQRPAWTFLERWIPVSTLTRRPLLVPELPWRTIGILLALMALLVAGGIISLGLRSKDVPAPYGPAANGQIAYVADGDIYSRDLQTGAVKLLVGGAAEDVSPAFSPDGQTLGFLRLGGDTADHATLMVADADGASPRELLGPAVFKGLAWSPSSDAVAAVAEIGDGSLFVVPTTGGEPRSISVPVVAAGEVVFRPPNGDELIFVGAEGGARAIYGVRADGSEFRKISADGGVSSHDGPWAVTPDGSRLLFTSGGGRVQIQILDLETGEARAFGAELPAPEDPGGIQHHGRPSILPDGKTIVFGRYWNERDGEINHQLWTASLDLDGADAVPIGPVHRSRSGHNPFWHVVAPDGESILVVENDTLDAWLADPAGGTPEMLDLGEVSDEPSWQRVAP